MSGRVKDGVEEEEPTELPLVMRKDVGTLGLVAELTLRLSVVVSQSELKMDVLYGAVSALSGPPCRHCFGPVNAYMTRLMMEH